MLDIYRETLPQTVQRVALEELGIKIKNSKLIGYIEYPNEYKARGFGWSVGIAFLAKLTASQTQLHFPQQNLHIFSRLPKHIIKEQALFLQKTFPFLR